MLPQQKRLEVTENALCDLEGRYKQANSLIKEKEYLISNLLKSGEPWTETLEIYVSGMAC